MTELEPRLNDADAQKVLARAAELQAQRAGTLSVSQVREIAAELSISESAVDQALLEHRGATNPATESSPSPAPSERGRNTHPFVLAMAAVGSALAFLLGTAVIMRLFP